MFLREIHYVTLLNEQISLFFSSRILAESLAQELEMERKTRAANAERDVKSPLSERPTAYYKNSVLFGSAN